MTITEILSENQITITYKIPDLKHEWKQEAKRYEKLKSLSLEEWINIAQNGKQINVNNLGGLSKISNTTAPSIDDAKANFNELEPDKQHRFIQAFSSGKIELPIVIKINGKLDLMGGNTRYTGLVSKGIIPDVWYIDVDSVTLPSKKTVSEGKLTGGLTKWFKEKWVNIAKKEGGKHPACGTSGETSGYAKCVPAKKAASMSAKEKKSAVNRKRSAQRKAGRPGRESGGTGKAPIRVKTDK